MSTPLKNPGKFSFRHLLQGSCPQPQKVFFASCYTFSSKRRLAVPGLL